MQKLLALIVFLLLPIGVTPTAWAAGPKASDLVKVELIAEAATVVPGEPFWVGIKLSTREHWHTYWRNPGDSGLPTEVTWSLPDGLTAEPLQWPTPERIEVSKLVNYGYEGDTVLLARMTPSRSRPADGSVQIAGKVTYLVCERECIPGEANLSLTLPAGRLAAPPPDDVRATFDAARARLPQDTSWATQVRLDGDDLAFSVDTAGLAPGSVRGAYLFPFDETAVDFEAAQAFSTSGSQVALRLKRGSTDGEAPSQLGGVLVLSVAASDGTLADRAFSVGSPPAAAGAAASGSAPVMAPPRPALSVWDIVQVAGFAFLGGLVLNLMPCVFPVLSIKVLSLVRHAGHSPALVRLNGLAYAAGVVLSFLALAGLLLAIRAGGAEIGWGFQLQNPAFVTALAFLLLAMGLSLSGAVEFGTSLAGVGGGLAERSGLWGSFFTGVLATVVATPCTAPFMGTAIGYAVTAPAAIALAIFAALGIGLALPFVILTSVPRFAGMLPRPGRWMEIVKQALAFPIYATVAWLVFVLSQEVGPTGLFAALVGLVVVGFAAWVRRLSMFSGGWARLTGSAVVVASIAALVAVGAIVDSDRAAPSGVSVADGSGIEPFTQARLDALQAEGRPVFVNLTAAWCITCLVNERVALATEPVRDAFRARRVAYLKGDWTNQNPEITRLLEQHGRSGVPLYLLYPGRGAAGSGEAVVLPQILTTATVLDSLEPISIGPITTSKRADADQGSTRR